MSDITPPEVSKGLKQFEPPVISLSRIETGSRKLSSFLKNRSTTLIKYLDPYSGDRVQALGDIDTDVLMFVLDKYFPPINREARVGFPAIPPGQVRLFRGEQARSDDEGVIPFEGQGRWWSQYLDIAADFAEGDEGTIYFIDVPEDVAQRGTISRTEEELDRPVGGSDAFAFEFYVPANLIGDGKGIENTLDPEALDALLRNGEFTRFENDPRNENESRTEEQDDRSDIRGKLINLTADALLDYWSSYKYEHDPNFREKHPDAENYTKPKWPNSPEAAEYLLAKISGWK